MARGDALCLVGRRFKISEALNVSVSRIQQRLMICKLLPLPMLLKHRLH
jgi:hypothetical protein